MTTELHHASQFSYKWENRLNREPPNSVINHLDVTSIQDTLKNLGISAMQSLKIRIFNITEL